MQLRKSDFVSCLAASFPLIFCLVFIILAQQVEIVKTSFQKNILSNGQNHFAEKQTQLLLHKKSVYQHTKTEKRIQIDNIMNDCIDNFLLKGSHKS